jgi:Na+-transporting NADH:ubiquinone oxidoreductase subunit NqrA
MEFMILRESLAVVGSEVKNPQYYKTYTGASVKKFIEGNLKAGSCSGNFG